MATTDDIARLRRLADAADVTAYPATDLSARIDAAGSVEAAAADMWRERAASYAALVDTTEGSSSRKLSQLKAQALEMAVAFDQRVLMLAGGSRPHSRAITRG